MRSTLQSCVRKRSDPASSSLVGVVVKCKYGAYKYQDLLNAEPVKKEAECTVSEAGATFRFGGVDKEPCTRSCALKFALGPESHIFQKEMNILPSKEKIPYPMKTSK